MAQQCLIIPSYILKEINEYNSKLVLLIKYIFKKGERNTVLILFYTVHIKF